MSPGWEIWMLMLRAITGVGEDLTLGCQIYGVGCWPVREGWLFFILFRLYLMIDWVSNCWTQGIHFKLENTSRRPQLETLSFEVEYIYFNNRFLHFIVSVSSDPLNQSKGIMPFKVENLFVNTFNPTLFCLFSL